MGIASPLAENTAIVLGWAREAISTTSSDWVSFKLYAKATVIITTTNAGASGIAAIAVSQGTNVAGGGAKALLQDMQYWFNADHAAGHQLTRATATLGSFSSDGVDSKEVIYVFEVRDGDLDAAGGFDTFQVTWATTANVTASCLILMQEPRFSSANPGSAIVN